MRTKNTEYFTLLERYINSYYEKYSIAPTLPEIERDLGISKATASRYLHYMTEHEMISYEGYRRITTKQTAQNKESTTPVQVLGSIACGLPKYAEENIEETIRIPTSWVGPGIHYALRANGDSMINAGINNGDIVIIRQQSATEPGQIIVALVDNADATLKRYRPLSDGYTVELVPENDAFQVQLVDLREQSLTIQGVAIKVIKDIV